ncbi:hypothetical protein [Streptomyces sp. NPDC005498]|uniref:hypothetical protein n=1 Tax=Streptomyces sp. NPDC005498 TaxID=3364717 RepID=UPI0036BF6451
MSPAEFTHSALLHRAPEEYVSTVSGFVRSESGACRGADGRTAVTTTALEDSTVSPLSGALWVVDGAMLRMGPQASSPLTSDSWRRP